MGVKETVRNKGKKKIPMGKTAVSSSFQQQQQQLQQERQPTSSSYCF